MSAASKRIRRRQLRPGLEIDHLGTLYRVIEFDRSRNLVLVENPKTGYTGSIPWTIIRERSRHAVQQQELSI